VARAADPAVVRAVEPRYSADPVVDHAVDHAAALAVVRAWQLGDRAAALVVVRAWQLVDHAADHVVVHVAGQRPSADPAVVPVAGRLATVEHTFSNISPIPTVNVSRCSNQLTID